MGGLWWQAALQLSASLLFVALSMPLFRRAALYVGLVDLPSTRKVHEAPIPYLGGLAIFIGVDASMVMSGGFSREANLVLLGGGAACALGLVDDWRSVRPVLRVVAEGTLAVALAAGGVRLHVTGRTALDSILTVCFLMAAPNALNLCDNMDALAGGLALTVSMSAAAIGAWYADPAILSLSVAVTGALIGYLVYNGPPATIFMGDSGSLMLGVLLGGLVCLCTQRVGGAGQGLAAASAFAVIFLDTLTVVVARPRHGRKVSDAGKDHLSHRLTLLGMGKERAVLVLVLHSAVVGLLGTLAATHHLAPVAALSVVVLVTAALAFICSVAPVYARAELVPPETLAVDLRERRASTQQQPVPIAAGSRVW